ncbi:DUF1028 domain-containing protein [Paracraurococcus lichenis]|uniref:DUF1028 domain-containing protein n=1 Tax=Paracraurococcus lichenis TaxID=3064888 RepID=A0ABT9DT53_9PROT|nr:DUF1028 domain-containing protein [Paracraurococcus sp. LOR1-02]MDO9707075.1 DUF1028 domain-containing protein [Paracraurococcus sp. LOR1-02]
MTWSIVAHDPATGAFAVAVSTCNFAVGASCPFLRAGVGAVSTQSFTNRYLGPAILDALERGLAPADAIESALAGDKGRGIRQVHCVDRHGRSAAFTGDNCVDWCGDSPDKGFSVAGNMLAGPGVVAGTAAAFRVNSGLPLPERLMLAMEAGEAEGGDKRGRQSAAMLLTTTEDFPDLNLRVDDHKDPLVELRRLLGIWREVRAPFLEDAPRKADPSGKCDIDAIETSWIDRGVTLRFRR